MSNVFQHDNSEAHIPPKTPVVPKKDSNVVSSKLTPLHGIKTVMHVDVIAPNQLRFVDELEPPDLTCIDGENKGDHDKDSVEFMQEEDSESETEEMVEETHLTS
ncbi:putative calpain-1 catalytic subunit-like [Sesbania bispinosa]|nr:putative calpain-1 catalytic subunit-like [Sesbania bispinosa]